MDEQCDSDDIRGFLGLMQRARKLANVPKRTINGWSSIAEFLLHHGRFWPIAQSLPPGVKMGEPQQCYMNAGMLAIDNRDLIYCEGFACGFFPVAHAWCLDKDGRVVDTTWRKSAEPSQYFGIPIRTDYLMRIAYEVGTWSGVIYTERRPLHPAVSDRVKLWKHPIHKLGLKQRPETTTEVQCRAQTLSPPTKLTSLNLNSG